MVGSGEVLYTLGTTNITILLDGEEYEQIAHVLDMNLRGTTSKPIIIGMDFLHSPRCTGIITWPKCSLLFDGRTIPLNDSKEDTHGVRHVKRLFNTESYTLTPSLREEAIETLGIARDHISIDLFANLHNYQENLFCTRKKSAFFFNWSTLCEDKQEVLWANPPWTQLEKVAAKIILNPCRILLVIPVWKDTPWYALLMTLATKVYSFPSNTQVYHTDFNEKPMPSPHWDTSIV